jgi:predicted transposase YdaD
MHEYWIITYFNNSKFKNNNITNRKTVPEKILKTMKKQKSNMKERLLIARNMKEMGMPVEHIAMATGLSINEIEKIII